MKSLFGTLRTYFILIAIVSVTSVYAELISIEKPNKGFMNNDPTQTFYWQGVKAIDLGKSLVEKSVG